MTEEPGNTDTLGNNGEKPQNCPRGVWGGFSKKVMPLIAQLNCLCSNACGMENNQKEQETMEQLENCHIIAITETRWDELHTWNTMIEG